MNVAAGKIGSWESRDSGRKSSNGKPEREILLSSLPVDLQQCWTQQQCAVAAELRIENPNPEEPRPIDSLDQITKLLSAYPAEEREAWIAEALRLNDLVNRYEAINPKRTRVAGGVKLEFVPAVRALCKEAACTNEIILAALANRSRRGAAAKQRVKPVSPHTLDDWARRRKQIGLLAFIRSKSSAKKPDDGRLADMSPAAAEWLEKHWRNYPIVKHLYDDWKKAAQKHRWKIPAISYLQRRRQAVPPVVKAALFQSDKVYTDKYKPFHARSAEDLGALQLLCGDHHVLDVFCWSEKRKELVRLWLTGWQCVKTSLIWGAHVDYTPSSYTIGCAYANGVRAYGAQPPKSGDYESYIYTDNGKDYRSRNINGEIEIHKQAAAINGGLQLLLTQRGVGLARDADVKQMLARAFNGREKPYERTGRDLADRMQTRFFKRGWCGRNTKDKPDSYSELYKRHLKAVKAGNPSPFPLEDEVRAEVFEWICDYNTSAHTRGTLGGRTIVPIEEYAAGYPNRFDISEETLALLTMKTIPGGAALRKNGVAAFGSSYWHEEFSKWKGKKGADGKALRVEVRYLDSDYTTVWIVLPDGEICEAERVDLGSYITPNKESLKAFAQRVRSEADLIKKGQLLRQSILRGESVEDRIVAELPQEQPEEVRMPIAVGERNQGQASVHLFNRFDARKHRAPVARMVTAEEVSTVESDESIFSDDDRGAGRVVEFDFENE